MSDASSAPPAPRQGRPEGGVRAVTRALALLDAFDAVDTSHSVAGLARLAGLPRTTTLRMVDTLVEEGMLTLGDDGNVRVGPRLIRWGALSSAAWDVPDETLARMRGVASATGETVSIYIRQGLRRLVIGQAPSPHTLRHAVQVGDELPLWGGAAALVLIAMEPEPVSARLVVDIAAESKGRVAPATLAKLVSEARRNGYAVSHGGRAEGTSGLAVPLRPASGAVRIPAGLALGGPTFRFDAEAVPRFLEELRGAADEIALSGLPAALY